MLLGGRTATVFPATTAEFGCRNFEAKPPAPRAAGFVTIWKNGRIAWQGPEDQLPARYRDDDPSGC
ncbi:hypothetical protein [Agrobacterium radiobacter]|uniref:hypothetical protein n=1 Tax=Agrobacterium radiobacter TaxID=362 RepID=UPI003F848D0C